MKDAETRTAGNPACPNCARLAARVAEVEAECASLRTELERERKRVGELKLRLGRNSGNSHRPPSSPPRPYSPLRGERAYRSLRQLGSDPREVAGSAFGPRLTALESSLAGAAQISRRS